MGVNIGAASAVAFTSPGTTLAVTGSLNWMNVNANGILTRPQTPYMRGQLSGQATPYNAGGAAMKITAHENSGGCWSDTTGLFTCPIGGYYMATGGGIANAQAGYFVIRKNGGDMHFTHWNHMSTWHYVTLSAIVPCAAGDYLSWHINGLTPGTNGFYGDAHGMYSFALMA